MIVYAVSATTERNRSPVLTNYHRLLCAARVTGSRSGTYTVATVGKTYPKQMEFSYNVYRVPEILEAEASLLVSDNARRILEKHSAHVDYLPTRVSSTYFVPYEPDDDRHEPYINMSLMLPFAPIDDAIDNCRVESEVKRFYELAMKRTGQASFGSFRQKKFLFKKGLLFSQELEVEISPEWVEEYKIYSGECYIMEEGLHDELYGLFPSPYYRSTAIRV